MSFIPMGHTERKQVNLEWNIDWFSQKPSEYNHELARMCCFLADAAYSLDEEGEPNDIVESYIKLGADRNSISTHYHLNYENHQGNDQCAYSLATVPLKGNSSLVILTIRGTPAGDNEWLSNLNIANSKETKDEDDDNQATGIGGSIYHEGFLNAEQIILKALLKYIGSSGMDSGRIKLLIAGHSRGAAVANIIGSHIVHQNLFDTEKCYIYTIACPNVTTLEEDLAQGSKFSFIWNIINGEDIVPCIPFNKVEKWNYRKFGNIKVLSTAWSAGREKFYKEIIPKMNELYCYLTGKNYQPSGAGSFMQVQMGKLLAYLNPDVDSFYKGPFSMHKPMSKMVPAMFPSKEEQERKKEKGPSFMDKIFKKVDEQNNGTITRIFETLNNLHQSESYLSFLTSLDEEECFNSSPSVQLIIKGLPEAAVLDSEGKEITRIREGQTDLFEIHESMSTCILGPQLLALGFPLDEEFKVVLTDTSIFPNPVSITTEFYSAEGVLMSSEEENIYPCRSTVYSLSAGKPLMRKSGIDSQVLKGEQKKEAKNKTGIWRNMKNRLSVEASIDSDLNLGLGLLFGNQLVYGLGKFRFPIQDKIFGTWEIDAGIGHKEKLWNSTFLNAELIARGVVVTNPDLRVVSDRKNGKEGVFSFVPAVRLSTAWQPLRKTQIFASATGSFFIKGLNDAAFESHMVNIKPIEFNDKLGLVISLEAGIRF